MNRAPLRVGVLGAGTVGAAVVRAFHDAPERLAPFDGRRLVLAGVAVRDVAKARAAGVPADLLTDAPAHLIASAAVDVVVELIGGDEPARTLVSAALGAGKPVVTANKHLLAHHGAELEAIARRAETALRFEASVGGGIPVLGPLARDLAADRIDAVRGIVNGTTNHILTEMAERGASYADALAAAQAAGYAEADPTGDVEGDDAVDKLVVLARLAFGAWLDPGVISRRPVTVGGDGAPGITGVRADELAAAAVHGLAIKLVAGARRIAGGSIAASVAPVAVPIGGPFGRTSGVLNRIEVEAEPVGRVAFSGPGAGGGPTSSAVLGDLVEIARGAGSTWAGLVPADRAPAGLLTGDADEPRRWFFRSTLPEQLVRDQVDLEAAREHGFVTVRQALDQLRAGLAAAGIAATLYPIED